MADYIKPFISDHKGNARGFKEKLEQEEEEKPLVRSGMGDFDYESFPLAARGKSITDKELFDHFSNKTHNLFVNIDNEIAKNFEERKYLDSKMTTIEREMEKRKHLYDMCLAISKEESVEIERFSEKNKKIDSSISYLQQMLDSWQCLIDDFRKIPDECD